MYPAITVFDHRYSDWCSAIAPSQLPQNIRVVQDVVLAFAVPVLLLKPAGQQRPQLHRPRRKRLNPRRHVAQHALHRIQVADLAVRQQQPAAHLVVIVEPPQQFLNFIRILPLAVVQQHVAAEVRIAAQNLVRSLSGEHHLVACIAHRAAQQILRDTVRIDARRLCLCDGIGEESARSRCAIGIG